jgi:hypothetical protein
MAQQLPRAVPVDEYPHSAELTFEHAKKPGYSD